MRRKTAIKLVVLPTICLAGWFATGPLEAMAPHPGSVEATKPAQAEPVRGDKTVTRGVAPTPDVPKPFTLADLPPKMVDLSRLDAFAVASRGNAVRVHAAARMVSRMPGPLHLWRLTVTDAATRAIVSDVPYWDQRFAIPASGVIAPTFDESIELPTGRYRVELVLNVLGEGDELADIMNADREDLRPGQIVGAADFIAIP